MLWETWIFFEGHIKHLCPEYILFFFFFTYDINALLTADHPGGPWRQPRHPAPSHKFSAASEPLALTPTGWARRPRARGPFTFRMMERLVSSTNSTHTCVHCPCKPVLPNTLVTLASLMGCTRLVSMMASRRRSGGEPEYTLLWRKMSNTCVQYNWPFVKIYLLILQTSQTLGIYRKSVTG